MFNCQVSVLHSLDHMGWISFISTWNQHVTHFEDKNNIAAIRGDDYHQQIGTVVCRTPLCSYFMYVIYIIIND